MYFFFFLLSPTFSGQILSILCQFFIQNKIVCMPFYLFLVLLQAD